jgi:hypothetical protein
MKRAFAFRCIFVAILCVFAGISAKAQAPTGTINGGVTDPGGAVVTGANVTATNQTTTVPRTTVTNSDGLYNFPDLPAGMYTVTIKATGFAETEFKDVQLLVGRVVTVDAQLKVASANASVTVGDAIDTVDLTTNTIQGQVTSTTIQSIPLNGRNFLELAYLVPGNRPAPNFDPTKTNTLERRGGRNALELPAGFDRGIPDRDGAIFGGSRTLRNEHHQHFDEERHERLSRIAFRLRAQPASRCATGHTFGRTAEGAV